MVFDAVGNTPLLELKGVAFDAGIAPGVSLWAKAEFCSPTGSVKDRAVSAMLLKARAEGLLGAEKTIIDATSGNSGISYAAFGAALGRRVKIYLPANANVERKRIIRCFGAEIVETDPLEGSDGAYLAVQKEVATNKEAYYYPDQYNNRANLLAHYNGTANEIWAQTRGKVTHFVSVTGTSGTFMGTTLRLKELNPAIKSYSVQPDSPLHGIEGTKHIATTIVPGFYNPSLADSTLDISTEDAYEAARKLALREGILAGVSSGANVAAALKLAKTLQSGLIVTVLCDTGSRYLSESFWNLDKTEAPHG